MVFGFLFPLVFKDTFDTTPFTIFSIFVDCLNLRL